MPLRIPVPTCAILKEKAANAKLDKVKYIHHTSLVFSFEPILAKISANFSLSFSLFCDLLWNENMKRVKQLDCCGISLNVYPYAVFNLEISQNGSYVFPHCVLNWVISKMFWVKLRYCNFEQLTTSNWLLQLHRHPIFREYYVKSYTFWRVINNSA